MNIVESVAAVLVHAEQVFTIRRQNYLDAFPGYDSFPGGKIDHSDIPEHQSVKLLEHLAGDQIAALVRELREELGFDLITAIERGEVTAVRHLATILAPDILPRRFRLHYYRIDLTVQPDFDIDSGEIAAAGWDRPAALLQRFQQGEALMVPPFRAILTGLMNEGKDGDFVNPYTPFTESGHFPIIEVLDGLRTLPIPSRSLPPIKTTNAFLIGDADAPLLLVDPSPATPEHFSTLCQTLAEKAVTAILITHHHPDHHEFAPELATHLKVPLLMSRETETFLLQRHGGDYLAGQRIVHLEDGETVTRWKGEEVRVYAVPGHDLGQIALAPESRRWFLVGDLIQGSGTVVILPEEGNMAHYFATLQRIIALAPAVIVPSHGMPLRGTHRLSETLRHRQKREDEILQLVQGGDGVDEILAALYQKINPSLLPFARANIVAHLDKLALEGRI